MEIEDVAESTHNVTIRNNRIQNLKCWTKEYPSTILFNQTTSANIQDARGGLFQFIDAYNNRDLAFNRTDSTYAGNVVSDAQIMVSKAIHERIFSSNKIQLQTKLNRIPPWLIKWAEGVPIGGVKPKLGTPKYRCHGDSMFHFVKGIVGIRIEET
jgi:hypothetical protein